MPQFSAVDILTPSNLTPNNTTTTTTTTSSTTQYCIARALFNNIPDTPDELAFEKGDNLIVLEQNTGNLEGWWLCSLRGRQGICPANRLRLIPGIYENSMQPTINGQQFPIHDNNNLSSCRENGGYRHVKIRSWVISPNQMSTSKMFNDIYLYDTPPSRCSPVPVPGGLSPGLSPLGSQPSEQNFESYYDTLPSHSNKPVPVCGDDDTSSSSSFRICMRCSPAAHHGGVSLIGRGESCETYDVPKSLPIINNYNYQHHHNNQLTPSSSISSLTTDSHSLSSSNRSSLTNMMPEYDVPRSIHHHHRPINQIYDVPVSSLNQQQIKELPLELNSALENLERLQNDTASATSRLLAFVSPNWRTRSKLENSRLEIKLAVTRLRTSLHDLAEFGEGALGNAAKASDKNLVVKLAPLVSALRKSDKLIQNASDILETKHKWSIEHLTRPIDEEKTISSSKSPDELEQLIACSRSLTDDVRQIASFIQGNGTLLFKKEQQTPSSSSAAVAATATTYNQIQPSDWMTGSTTTTTIEEYDYVSFDSKDNVKRTQKQLLNELPKELKKGYENCVKLADEVAYCDHHDQFKALCDDDRQLLIFYATQAVSYHDHLTLAIDAFLQTVEHNQPPKIFLAHGKFVVLNAHKLVNIGDTVHRNIAFKHIKDRALNCSNALSDALATSVNKTKHAAQQFPSVAAVQEMVNSIVEISHLAKDLKVCLVQAANS